MYDLRDCHWKFAWQNIEKINDNMLESEVSCIREFTEKVTKQGEIGSVEIADWIHANQELQRLHQIVADLVDDNRNCH
jgi:hypothetical protein